MPFVHAEPENTSTERGGAVVSPPDGKSAADCLTSAVFNSCRQLLYSGNFGNVNLISSGAALSTMKTGTSPCSFGPSTKARKRPSGKFQSCSVMSSAAG